MHSTSRIDGDELRKRKRPTYGTYRYTELLKEAKSANKNLCTVFDPISEHTLISGHPPFCAGEDYC